MLFLAAYERSKRRAMMITLPTMSETMTEAERSIHLSSLVPFDKINVVGL